MIESNGTMSGRTCMITGATSGIGRATAVALARLGASLVLVCRDQARGASACECLGFVLRLPRIGADTEPQVQPCGAISEVEQGIPQRQTVLAA